MLMHVALSSDLAASCPLQHHSEMQIYEWQLPVTRPALIWAALTDGRYLGKGVQTAVRNINEIIAPALKVSCAARRCELRLDVRLGASACMQGHRSGAVSRQPDVYNRGRSGSKTSSSHL